MPRPNKAFRRNKINAAIAYKRGDRKEAYTLWAKASAGIAELREKKQNKKGKAAAEVAAAEAAAAAAAAPAPAAAPAESTE